MHEHELHVSRALAGAKLLALKKLCILLDRLDPETQFAEIRRVASTILRAKGDDIEPDFGCAVPPAEFPPTPPHKDPNYHDDRLQNSRLNEHITYPGQPRPPGATQRRELAGVDRAVRGGGRLG